MIEKRNILGYALIAVSLVAALVLRWWLDDWLDHHLPLVTLFGAVAVAVWLGGYRTALVVTVLGYLACNWLFIPPKGALSFVVPRDVVGVAAGLFTSLIIIGLGEAMRVARRRSQQAASELRTVTERMSVPVTRCSRDFRYVWVSQAYADWLGRPASEIVGHPIVDVIGTEAFGQLRSYFERVLRGETVEYEALVPFQGKGARWINAAYAPTYDGNGQCDGWVAVVVDIHDRKSIEEELVQTARALRERDERYELVLAGADAAIWDWDVPARRVLYSPRWTQLRGLTEDEVSDREEEWSSGIHPDDVDRVMSAIQAHFEGKTPLFAEEYRVRHRDGHWIWVLDRGLARRDETGRVVRMAGSETDITERKRSEAALRESDRRKDEFLAMLSHELRNPLAPIGYAAQLMQKAELRESELQWIREVLDRQVHQLQRLLDDLLDVSRITRGTIELRRQRLELSALVRDAVETSRPMIESAGHELRVEIPQEPVVLDADPARMTQVLLNLLNNAAKYTERGGRIRIDAARDGESVVIRVADTGVGIPADRLDRVFELFAQEDRSIERSRGGLGIGLSLARRLVEMHGGTIQARSDGPGCGSEFILRLPALEGSGPVVVTRLNGTGGASGPRALRVLVVDDNRDAVDGMARFLSEAGHEVRKAYDGLGAVAESAEFQPDVVVLDIGLPKLNGYDAALAIRARSGAGVRLIALTGWGQEEHRRRSREAGFDHHLTKPVSIDELNKLLGGIHPRAGDADRAAAPSV